MLKKLIFEPPKAQKNENLLICAETSKNCPKGPLGAIFEESAFEPLERGVDSLKRLKTVVERLDQFLSHQKKDHAKMAAWAVHLQQQQPTLHCEAGETPGAGEETPRLPPL